MRTKSLDENDKKEELSFAFKQPQIEPSQVAAHWEKIKARLESVENKKVKKTKK